MRTAVTQPEGLVGAANRRRLGTDGRSLRHQQKQEAAAQALQRISAEVELQAFLWDLSVNRAMVVVAGLATACMLVLWPAIGGDLALPVALAGVASAAYFGLCWALALRAGGRWLRLAPWVNATIEGGLGTLCVALVLRVKGAEWAMTTGALFVYPLAIIVTSARMRPWLCAYATGIAVVGHVILYYVAIAPALAPNVTERLPTLGGWMVWERAFWLILMGGVAAFATHRFRKVLLSGGRSSWERAWIEKELGRYVSKDVADAILRGDAGVGRGERRDVTVLFCDLRDFTGICEQLPPEEVVTLLNTFYGRACQVVEAHGGTINKFLGDGVLALFGAPVEHPNHPHAAAEAAQDLLVAIDELRLLGGAWDRFDVGIGLDTGDVVVGAIGANERADYTAIGSVVNRAARLQGLAGRGRHRIVLSRALVDRLGPRANVVSMGDKYLKGFSAAEPVYAFRHS